MNCARKSKWRQRRRVDGGGGKFAVDRLRIKLAIADKRRVPGGAPLSERDENVGEAGCDRRFGHRANRQLAGARFFGELREERVLQIDGGCEAEAAARLCLTMQPPLSSVGCEAAVAAAVVASVNSDGTRITS